VPGSPAVASPKTPITAPRFPVRLNLSLITSSGRAIISLTYNDMAEALVFLMSPARSASIGLAPWARITIPARISPMRSSALQEVRSSAPADTAFSAYHLSKTARIIDNLLYGSLSISRLVKPSLTADLSAINQYCWSTRTRSKGASSQKSGRSSRVGSE